jgi:hypothetical protein
MVGLPLKVSGRLEAAWIAPSFSRSAIDAAPMVTGAVPYALVKTTRAFDPPTLVWTICRSV